MESAAERGKPRQREAGYSAAMQSTQFAAPAAVLQLLECLQRDGHEAVLAGGCIRDLLRGAPVRDWDIATSARPERSLVLFPRAVPTGLRHGAIMAPCAAGPVDVTTFRGASLAEDLARRDFTINAMAWDPLRNAWHDPHGGRADLAAQILRAVGRAADRLTEDPLRALRAARLLAALNLRMDPALREALPGAAEALAQVAPERIRSELERLLLAPRAGRGMALLRHSTLEAALLPGVRADAAALVQLLPADLELRLAAWLRGAGSGALSRWRFPKNRARNTERLLALHPVDRWPSADAAMRRLRKRAGSEENLGRLFTLREAELQLAEAQLRSAATSEVQTAEMQLRGATDAAQSESPQNTAPQSAAEIARTREKLAALRAALKRTRGHAISAAALALDGRAVMEILGIGPGPMVGRALRHLLECVLEDPAQNQPGALRALLCAWRGAQTPPLSPRGGSQ